MKPLDRLTAIGQLIVVLLIGAAIKLFYSTASVNDLLWILAPTRLLVGLTTGVGFTFESYSGYMSTDHSFLIAAPCSGVNFMITAFLVLALGKLWRYRSRSIGFSFIPLSLVFAYLTTIVANTVRISTALYIRRLDRELIWLNPKELHRFEGIVIYFGFLLILFIVSENAGPDVQTRPNRSWARLWRYLLPLAIYYVVTIGGPLANGALRRGPVASDFWHHSLFVLLTPIILLFPIAVIGLLKNPLFRSLIGCQKTN
ncbi:MAG: exosortase K [Chloracidobacterium sp.]|nr:exosortase K [Chloracidobacterium sp.]